MLITSGDGPGVESNCALNRNTTSGLAGFCPAGCAHGGHGGVFMLGDPPFQLIYYARNVTYGNADAPVHPGCGFVGSAPNFARVRGGGVVRIDIVNAITWGVGGRITADGESSNSSFVGGASGGSVWISAGSASIIDSGGNPTVSAAGGNASVQGGGGAGGRLALPILDKDEAPWSTIATAGVSGGTADGKVMITTKGTFVQGGGTGASGSVAWK